MINSKSSEGKADSSGHFTIDVAKAREMLEARKAAQIQTYFCCSGRGTLWSVAPAKSTFSKLPRDWSLATMVGTAIQPR